MPSIPPHGEATVNIDGVPSSGDSTITFIYTAKEGVPVLEPGHELGFDEIVLSEEKPELAAPAPGKVDIACARREIVLTGEGFRYSVNKLTGLFNELCWHNKSFLTRPMEWNLYRAPTDNDQYVKIKWH